MRQATSFSNVLLSAVAAIIFFSVIIVACKKESQIDETSLDNKMDLISTRLNLVKSKDSIPASTLQSIISNVTSNGMYYSSVSSKIDQGSGVLFINEDEQKFVTYFKFSDDTTRSYSIYGYITQNKFVVSGEILNAKTQNNDGSYSKFVVKNNEAFEVTVQKDGKRVYHDLSSFSIEKWEFLQTKDCEGNHGGSGFCQREKGESFGTCHAAEVAEFSDDFLGWAFYKVNESIVDAVIAASCLCTAKGCK